MSSEVRPKPLGVRATADVLGVHENTVRNWVKSGDLRVAGLTPGGHKRFDPVDVAALLLRMQGAPESDPYVFW